MKAMLLAAGLGTRLRPFTDQHPKALVKVNHKTLLQRNIEYLKSHGVTELIINVHHFAGQILEFLNEHHHFDIPVFISDETEAVLETGGGLKKASWFFMNTDAFILMNVDILTNLDLGAMWQFHQERQPLATLAISRRNSSRSFLFNADRQLCGWSNQSTGEERISRREDNLEPLSFSGIHILSGRILPLLTLDGKFSMVDVYLELAKQQTILGYDHTGCHFIDVGKPESIVQAEALFD